MQNIPKDSSINDILYLLNDHYFLHNIKQQFCKIFGFDDTIKDIQLIDTMLTCKNKLLGYLKDKQVECSPKDSFQTLIYKIKELDNNSAKLCNLLGLAYNTKSEEVISQLIDNKNKLVNILKTKGVKTDDDTVFNLMAKVALIDCKTELNNNIQEVTKLNITASKEKPFIEKIKLKNKIKENILLDNVRSVKEGKEDIVFSCPFNITDASNFVFDEFISFADGMMELSKEVKGEWMLKNYEDETKVMEYEVDASKYKDITSIVDADNDVLIGVIHNPRISIMKNFVNLEKVNEILGINYIGTAKLLMTFDNGTTWYGMNEMSEDSLDIEFKQVDIKNIEDVKKYSISSDNLVLLSKEEIEKLRNKSENMKFAFYLKEDAYSDNIELKVMLKCETHLVTEEQCKVTIEPDNFTATYEFYQDGTYSITYLDE